MPIRADGVFLKSIIVHLYGYYRIEQYTTCA